MKRFMLVLIMILFVGAFNGCHSGTMRGVGSDISRVGDHLQK